MATKLEHSAPRWQARLAWVARVVDVELHGDEAAKAAAELAEHGIPGNRGFVYSTIRKVKFIERFAVRSQVVEFFRPGREPVRFRLNRNKSGQITFTDTREGKMGIAGTTGIWGTRPPPKLHRPRSMTPTAFKVEAARFVGMERAEEILREITQEMIFEQSLANVTRPASHGERG